MSGKRFHIVIAFLVAVLMSSCSIRRFVPEGKYLVQSNKVVIEEKDTQISKSGISKYISLKPYKSTFQTNFPTWIYYHWDRHQKSAWMIVSAPRAWRIAGVCPSAALAPIPRAAKSHAGARMLRAASP